MVAFPKNPQASASVYTDRGGRGVGITHKRPGRVRAAVKSPHGLIASDHRAKRVGREELDWSVALPGLQKVGTGKRPSQNVSEKTHSSDDWFTIPMDNQQWLTTGVPSFEVLFAAPHEKTPWVAQERWPRSGRTDWPARAVYFCREPGEIRSDTVSELRIG
jgi:hypothetical protein